MRRDWALAAALAALAVVEVVVRTDLTFRWASFAVALAGIPALPWRRTHPLPVVGLVFGAALALQLVWILDGAGGVAPGLYTTAYVLLLPYALFRWGSGRHAAAGLPVMLVPATISTLVGDTPPSEAITGFAVFFGTIALGLALRYRAHARTARFDEVRARERERLARDLHDTVAHHVSAIAIRAQAGVAVAPGDPGAAVEALRVIDAEATRTLAEMRTLVRGLRRDDPVDLAPVPLIADVRDLATALPGGPAVHVDLEGDPAGVPAPVSTAAYRLVQESITNARRHARRASRIDVRVAAGGDAVTVHVTDDGEPAARAAHGLGIAGMTERAERLGGTCTAGPRAGRGWAVTAVLPIDGASR
jgi:signal transduction histidine kinase